MSAVQSVNMPSSLRRRLLQDITEVQQDPYPNVHLHFNDTDIHKACLVLTPENEDPLHLTINFPLDYPLRAPEVQIQSRITHPNVFGSYICATILNTTEGWTPAYTLQGIVIQLLSFFCSDSLEQDHGGRAINLADYRRRAERARLERQRQAQRDGQTWQYYDEDVWISPGQNAYKCSTCEFGPGWKPSQALPDDEMEVDYPTVPRDTAGKPVSINYPKPKEGPSNLFALPDEIVLFLLSELETRDVLALADAVPTIKTMVYSYDFIRVRELQCFCLKKSFMNAKLGIGVSIEGGRRSVFRSEFDLLSQEAFFQHDVRRSIQGVNFQKWLPLPLSRRHWNQVKSNATACLKTIHDYASMPDKEADHVDVLYNFMNSIVVQFSADAEKGHHGPDGRSTLSHASEKAVDSYFGLFHLLLCLATENSAIVKGANRIIARFLTGPRGKTRFPDLGHVLVAALISDAGLTEELTLQVIKEAILRNVVWMLDAKGAGMAELAYLEQSAVSDYRLVMTYHASPTSYRLLMFLKLFSSAARPLNKPLSEIRDSLFDTHGAPPPGTSAAMAQRIRKIRDIDSFPKFLAAMGIKDVPSKADFTAFLRRTITDSVNAGYSTMPMTQSQLYMIRKTKERQVAKADGVAVTPALERWYERGEKWYGNGWNGRPTFFPGRGGNHGGREDRAGNTRGRGRGHGRGRGRGG